MHVKQIKQTNQCWGLQLTNYGAANKQPVPAHAWCSEARLPPCAPCTHHVVADHVRQRGQQRPGRHGLLALLQRRPAHLIPLLEVVLLQLLPAPASSAERGREVAQVSMVTQRKAELQQQSSTRREAASNHAATHLYLFFRLLPPPSAAVAARRCWRLLQIADRGRGVPQLVTTAGGGGGGSDSGSRGDLALHACDCAHLIRSKRNERRACSSLAATLSSVPLPTALAGRRGTCCTIPVHPCRARWSSRLRYKPLLRVGLCRRAFNRLLRVSCQWKRSVSRCSAAREAHCEPWMATGSASRAAAAAHPPLLLQSPLIYSAVATLVLLTMPAMMNVTDRRLWGSQQPVHNAPVLNCAMGGCPPPRALGICCGVGLDFCSNQGMR